MILRKNNKAYADSFPISLILSGIFLLIYFVFIRPYFLKSTTTDLLETLGKYQIEVLESVSEVSNLIDSPIVEIDTKTDSVEFIFEDGSYWNRKLINNEGLKTIQEIKFSKDIDVSEFLTIIVSEDFDDFSITKEEATNKLLEEGSCEFTYEGLEDNLICWAKMTLEVEDSFYILKSTDFVGYE